MKDGRTRSPLAKLEQLAEKFTEKVYLIHFEGQAPYLLFPRHKVYYNAKRHVKWEIRTQKTTIATDEPMKHLLEHYYE